MLASQPVFHLSSTAQLALSQLSSSTEELEVTAYDKLDMHQQHRALAKKQTLCWNRQTATEVREESLLLYSPLLGCQQEHFGQVSLLHSMKHVDKSEDIQRRVEKGWIMYLI